MLSTGKASAQALRAAETLEDTAEITVCCIKGPLTLHVHFCPLTHWQSDADVVKLGLSITAAPSGAAERPSGERVCLRPWGWWRGKQHRWLWNLEVWVPQSKRSLSETKWAAYLCDLQSQQTAHHSLSLCKMTYTYSLMITFTQNSSCRLPNICFLP